MPSSFYFFFFNDTATTEIYTLSLHDALPISPAVGRLIITIPARIWRRKCRECLRDRKSTRLNSSHVSISYAVFCLKKKKIKKDDYIVIENLIVGLGHVDDEAIIRLRSHAATC